MDGRKQAIFAYIVLSENDIHPSGVSNTVSGDNYMFLYKINRNTHTMRIYDIITDSVINGRISLMYDSHTYSYLKIIKRDGHYSVSYTHLTLPTKA